MDLRELFSGGWERNLTLASAAFSAGALLVSILALVQTSRQVDIANESLRASEKNAAFISLINDLGQVCGALDFSRGANKFLWTSYPTSQRLQIVASYQPNYLVPRSDNPKLIQEVQAKIGLLDARQTGIQTWLEEAEYEFIRQSLFELKNQYESEVEAKRYVSISSDSYLKVAGLCHGTRDALLKWYRDPQKFLQAQMPRMEDVQLNTRGPRV
ncbi:hypothetical protein [Phyllobacterium myrsinacearum]|uniref:CHASE3 domain-containing protein n=1 Tax=Phyllobacterium myrsinacearum TaxID=28101 RepID=A0A2S9JB15_9HYPH|nr:hypothetical protein [Phyllobacterium myrsinacearum]PRD49975.1 hypothetical protein C5750_24465 [Phyllobacterium myrsinacearum]PWV86525.1 hypothetical protein DEV92_1167 [Phyllobacterium myrsinacearum]RZU96875.1 hypothetical protein EV654_5059 [Phyllobacterium myrsinacearum]